MTEIPERCVNVRNAGSIVDRPLLNTTSIGIRSDHMSDPPTSYPAAF